MSIKEDVEDALWRKLRKDNPIKSLRKDLAVNWKDKDYVHVRDDGTRLEAKEYSIQFVCRGELPIYAENKIEAWKIFSEYIFPLLLNELDMGEMPVTPIRKGTSKSPRRKSIQKKLFHQVNWNVRDTENKDICDKDLLETDHLDYSGHIDGIDYSGRLGEPNF